MTALWLVLRCGFGHERSCLQALPLKHERVTAASRKKNFAVRTRIGLSRLSTQDGSSWKRNANNKKCGPDQKCHNAGCDVADDDTVTYQAAPETDPRGQEGVPRPFLPSAVALPSYQHNQQTYQKQGNPEELFRYDIEFGRFRAGRQEFGITLTGVGQEVAHKDDFC